MNYIQKGGYRYTKKSNSKMSKKEKSISKIGGSKYKKRMTVRRKRRM